MAHPFDIKNKADREVRAWRTRAFAAELFAAYPRAPGLEYHWAEIARGWRELADMKERSAESAEQIRQQIEALKADVRRDVQHWSH
jgi:hypothetical protein